MLNYDEKIDKDKMNVIVHTEHNYIECSIHKFKSARLLDMLNKNKGLFIPASDASIYSKETGKLIYESGFMALNISRIISISERNKMPSLNPDN